MRLEQGQEFAAVAYMELATDAQRRHASVSNQDRRLAIAIKLSGRLFDRIALQLYQLFLPCGALPDYIRIESGQLEAPWLQHRAITGSDMARRTIAATHYGSALRDRQFDQGGPEAQVKRCIPGADHGRARLYIKFPLCVGCDLDSGFPLQQPDLAAVAREADVDGAIAVQVQAGAIGQTDSANLADLRLVMVHPAECANRHDCGEDEQDHGNAGHDHDVAGQSTLLLFSDDIRDGREIDLSCRAFQPFRSFPGRLCPSIGNRVEWIGLDPRANFGLVLRNRIAVKPCQQARGFRLDLFPAV